MSQTGDDEMIVRRVFWGALIIFLGGFLGVYLLPVLAPNFPPESIAVPYRLMYIAVLLILVSWIWAFIIYSRFEVEADRPRLSSAIR